MDTQKMITTTVGIGAVITLIILIIVYSAPRITKPEPLSNQKNTNQPMEQLGIQITQKGSGPAVQNGSTVEVHYTGTLSDGTKFDSSRDRGTPFSFTVGQGRVIQGWEQGLIGMQVGEKRLLTIPPSLAYGDAGFPPVIPPSATLTFEIELLSIK